VCLQAQSHRSTQFDQQPHLLQSIYTGLVQLFIADMIGLICVPATQALHDNSIAYYPTIIAVPIVLTYVFIKCYAPTASTSVPFIHVVGWMLVTGLPGAFLLGVADYLHQSMRWFGAPVLLRAYAQVWSSVQAFTGRAVHWSVTIGFCSCDPCTSFITRGR